MPDYVIPKAADYDNLSQRARSAMTWDGKALTPKFDGCALRIDVTPGQPPVFMSAVGKPVESCFHVIRNQNCKYTVVGEVIASGAVFEDVSGAFRRKSPQPHLEFIVFDFALHGAEDEPWWKRMMDARTMGYQTVHQEPTYSQEHCIEIAKHFKMHGYHGYNCDGAVVHDPAKPFILGRSKGDTVKVKPLLDYDLMCIGYEDSVGEKTGRPTVALKCRFKDNKVALVATGLTEAEQATPDVFVNQIIRVEAMGLTKYGNLREPRFAGVRHDKLKADF